MESTKDVKKANEHVDKNLKCEACEVDGIQKPATAFCVDCQDYLCFDCSSYHCVPKPTKHHKVLLQHEMPGRKASTSLSEDCAKHKGETIKFYCKGHKALGCHTCIATVHRTCTSLQAITDFTKDIDKAPLYNEVKKEVKEMAQMFKAQKNRIQEKDQLSRRCNATALTQMRQRRVIINKQFDKLEQNIEKESAKMSREDTLKMKQLYDSCTAKLDALEEIKSDLDLLEETKQQKQLFIATVKTAVKIREMKSALLTIKADTKIRQFQLFPNTLSNSLAVREDSLGQLEICEFENNMQADSKSSYEQVGISTLIEMQSTDVVATDYQRCLVVLYDCNFTKKGHLKVSTGPWDMTRTSENVVAVTLPHEKKIKFLYVDNRIQDVSQISAPGNCRGIAAVNDKLAVTFSNPAGIKILSGIGEVIKDIPLNTTTVQLKEPAYVAVDEDKNIFVTDPVTNSVAKMNLIGCVQGVCRDIKKPLHICVHDKNLLVSECDSAIVHILTPDFKKLGTEDSFSKDYIGDVSISPRGVSFQGILKMKQEELETTLHELSNVQFTKFRKEFHSNPDKKCVIL
ncbi:uncharacterized protein LOC128557310 [Mercenaria mercenaria]|uniref:uncharacterized protein LOC128557310 n=1 Tax=Mercenaria mercenaria TaxID=6596 RepID=UPI00234F9D0B|nr:uncharacterized protein LOC128557310 [Mercenaria mercenaria]